MFTQNSNATRSSNQLGPARSRGTILRQWVLTLLLIPAFIFAASSAYSQDSTTADTGFWGVITSNNVPLRCSNSEVFYIISHVQTGDVVFVTEVNRDSGWARINAPYGTTAFAYARDFELQADGTTAIAPALCYGRYSNRDDPKKSWKRYIIEPGTTVKVLGTVSTDADKYLRIEMPEYVPVSVVASFIRPASEDEITAHQKRLVDLKAGKMNEAAEEDETVTTEDELETPAAVPATEASTEEIANEDHPEIAASEETVRGNLQNEDSPSIETPTTDDPAEAPDQPEDTATVTADSENNEVHQDANDRAEIKKTIPAYPILDPSDPALLVKDPKTEKTEPAEILEPAVPLTFADLETLYENLKTVPILEAEIAPVLAGFRALADDESQSAAVRRRARPRVRLLEIRRDHQESRRRIKRALAEADDSILNALIANEILATNSGLSTALVGKLTLSSVYDGIRLPLRYRLRDRITGRTIAYVPPVENIELAMFLDEIVRITGTRFIDPALDVTVLKLKQISLLNDESQAAITKAPTDPDTIADNDQ